jgi:phosphoribosylformylglycinamidine synthase
MEKLLLEATLELITRGLVEGIQDMGAAGLTSSSCEMAARSGRGIEFSLDEIPKRADDLSAYEMLLSESQERMLAVIRKENLAAVSEVLDRWDLHGVVIGTVTDTGRLVVRQHGAVVADIPVDAITGNVPQYTREIIRPAYLDGARILPEIKIMDWARTFLEMLGRPDIASKEWVFGQYDYMVRNDTVVPPGGAGAAVVRLKETGKGVAMTTDCNAGFCWLDPRRGAMIAVAEAARNLAAVGARPLAVTNNLNFSNPEKSPIYYQLAECLAGMGEACRVFDTPVTGGNASLYNETAGRPILPTPVIGMVGLVDDVAQHCRAAFRTDGGDELWLLGTSREELGGSQLARLQLGRIAGECPQIDLEMEKRLVDAVISLIKDGLLVSCTDLSEGGLLVAAAEGAIAGDVGFSIDYQPAGLSPEAALFGESQGRFLVTILSENAAGLQARLAEAGIPTEKIGVTGGRMIAANGLISVPLATAHDAWANAIRFCLEKRD